MIPTVSVASAGLTFLFHVGDFAAGGHFAILADHASTREGCEAEKTNETHHALQEQFLYR